MYRHVQTCADMHVQLVLSPIMGYCAAHRNASSKVRTGSELASPAVHMVCCEYACQIQRKTAEMRIKVYFYNEVFHEQP